MVSKAEKRARAQAKLAAQTPAKTDAPTTDAPKAEAKVVSKVVGNLKVKTEGVNLRGARQAWYEVLKGHDGKPAQEYLEATTKKPPSLPKSGKQEPSSGWLRWFVRHGYATIVQPEQKA